jgi:mutator protein MutT
MTRIRVVAAVVEREGRYLVGRRPRQKRHGGLWEFPGGKLDEGESIADAAERELDEELGLTVTEMGRRLLAIEDEGSPFVIEFHAVHVEGSAIAHEHEELGWFSALELTTMQLAPADRTCALWLVEHDH